MIKPIKCIHCGIPTKTIFKSIVSKYKKSKIVLKGAPMHHCPSCNEKLISLEALSTFRYIKTLPLSNGVNEFNFNDVFDKSKTLGIQNAG